MLRIRVIILLVFFTSIIFSQNKNEVDNKDSVKSYTLKQIEVSAKRINLGEANNKISKDNLENVLDKNGFSLIRKGVFFAQDIYADGLKKGDIIVVIDGERYHSACPNRMDSPLTRINPLELESVTLDKSSNNIQSGLGGVVKFNRSMPSKFTKVQVGISTLSGAQKGIDAATSFDYAQQRIAIRYSEGSPFISGEKKSFSDMYNYKENINFALAEGSLRGNVNEFSYGLSISYTDNVSFPYLLMDERFNRVYSAFLSYMNNKIYLNYTNHVMDNDLRVNSMLMKTKAKNLTIGAIGDFYEFVYRNWDANNFFNSPMMHLENDLMPNVSIYSANLFKEFEYSNFQLHGKLGFSYQMVGERSRKDFYKNYFEEIKLERFFPTFSIGISRMIALFHKIGIGGLLELNSESPETETLFIAVKKPGTKPAWSGNPNLNQPLRATLRSSISYENFNLELFGSQIWNYNNLTKKSIDQKAFLTYQNIDASILGTNLNVRYKYFEINSSYVWAENKTNNSPLSEIPPLKVSTKLISPEYENFIIYLKHTYSDAQLRVDELLNETVSPAWNKFDLGLLYSYRGYNLSVEIENLFNANYFQHLSYLRDPFSSGLKVFEPGRVFRISLKAVQLF